MKKKFFKYVPMVLGLAVAFTSCSKDDDDDAPSNPFTQKNPVVTYLIENEGDVSTAPESVTVLQGSQVTLQYSAVPGADGKKLDKVTLNKPSDIYIDVIMHEGSNEYELKGGQEVDIKNADNSKFNGWANLNSDNLGTRTYEITVSDKDGNSTTITFDLTVTEDTGDDGDDETELDVVETGTIYHIGGSNRGSWDLINDTDVSGSANDAAHIINVDEAGETFTGEFEVGEDSDASFVVADASFDYDNATVESAEAAFEAGTELTTVSPAEGDVYIFNIDGEYVVVKITEIDALNDDCECENTGAMTFEYKKS